MGQNRDCPNQYRKAWDSPHFAEPYSAVWYHNLPAKKEKNLLVPAARMCYHDAQRRFPCLKTRGRHRI